MCSAVFVRGWHSYHRNDLFPMASPTLETLCCILDRNDTGGVLQQLGFSRHQSTYNILSIVVAGIGLLGAVYQMLPRSVRVPQLRPFPLHIRRHRTIICWLAFADFLATLGILLRSISWLSRNTSYHTEEFLCAVFSGWIQYFYTATYFWNLCYAIDVFRILQQKETLPMSVYHLLSWSCAALFSAIGLSIMYYPRLRCDQDVAHMLPNYLCTLIPLLVVMLCNPVLYLLASRQVRGLLVRTTGMYSHRERQVTAAVKEKFSSFVLVFYVCWLPNVVNSIVMWSLWKNLVAYRIFVYTIWYLMAAVNPLQAVLNAVVYRNRDDALRLQESWIWLMDVLKTRQKSRPLTSPDAFDANEDSRLVPAEQIGSPLPGRTSINGKFYDSI